VALSFRRPFSVLINILDKTGNVERVATTFETIEMALFKFSCKHDNFIDSPLLWINCGKLSENFFNVVDKLIFLISIIFYQRLINK